MDEEVINEKGRAIIRLIKRLTEAQKDRSTEGVSLLGEAL